MGEFEILELGRKRANELGLYYFKVPLSHVELYHSDTVHKLLGQGVEVFGAESRPIDGWNEKIYPSTSKRGLLLGIREIQKDTAELVLRELVECFIVEHSSGPFGEKFVGLLARAKAVLEKENEN